MKRSLFVLIFLFILMMPLKAAAQDGDAQRLDVSLVRQGGGSAAELCDDSYNSSVEFNANDSLSIKAPEGQSIGAIYIKWYKVPGLWKLSLSDGTELECGRNDFLHEYVSIENGGISECVMNFTSACAICEVYAYSEGNVPKDVQNWKTPCDKADLLAFSTHADDECLFLGGVLATYAAGRNLQCQVVYMTNYWDAMIIREHEKLDGLWAMGVKNYPIVASFADEYAMSLEEAERVYDRNAWTDFITAQIRRFKPQIVVCQDFNGEYGHGAHMLEAVCVKDAVESSMLNEYYPASASQYGTWDVPKTYFHLYEQNRISLDLRQPISALGGITAVDAAAAAYLRHVSQQWCWFYVSDDPNDPKADKINCAEFGLYRTTVGVDTGNDMMENIVPYAEKDRLEEEARIEEEKRLAEEEKAAKRERKRREKELAREEALKKKPDPISAGGVAALVIMTLMLAAGVVVYNKGRMK